jgi:ATP-dependent Lhr-like helicase
MSETVIVDEIHAVADDKRGVHLALSLERLEALTHRPPVRIGLSATQKPIEEVARFLAGNSDAHNPRPAMPVIVNVGHKRTLDLGVEVPSSELGPVASNEMWDEIYERIVQLVNAHRSTLVFVNTRRLAERISHQLGERLGEENVAAHHGSLSRKLRLEAERKLKEGQVKVLVATASLELGIDVGTVDLVCHISSPRSIAVALQRVGRSGHWRGAVPKGTVLCHHARRSGGMRRAGARNSPGRTRPADFSRSFAGCAGATDCRLLCGFWQRRDGQQIGRSIKRRMG